MRHSRIRQQASSDRPPCPPHNGMYVVEKVPCKVDDCFDFEWKKDDWSPCQMKDNAKCGKGIKFKILHHEDEPEYKSSSQKKKR